MTKNNDTHFNKAPLRKAEFFNPPNDLKNKIGNGGLSEDILSKAQALLENNTIEFGPLGEMYLDSIMKGIEQARTPAAGADQEKIIEAILIPAMQLKSNGGMFHYNLVTQIGDLFIRFLESIATIDTDAFEIIIAFHTTLRAIILGRIKGDGGQRGEALQQALVDACHRYFDKASEKNN